jgi:quercetin dioxygenase-like cupin family protein
MVMSVAPAHSLTYDGAQLNIYHVNTGEGLPKHDHTFSHASVCHAGSIVVRKKGKEIVMTKNTQPVNLVANEWHEIEALEDGTVFVNVFAALKDIIPVSTI